MNLDPDTSEWIGSIVHRCPTCGHLHRARQVPVVVTELGRLRDVLRRADELDARIGAPSFS